MKKKSQSDLFPTIPSSGIEKVNGIIRYITENVRFSGINPITLLHLGARTPIKIMRDRYAVAAFPCLDLAAVTAEMLIQNNIPSRIVVARRKSDTLEALHYTVELDIQGITHHIDVKRNKLVLISGPAAQSKTVRIRRPDGTAEPASEKREGTIPYTKSRANDPVYRIAGFPSRRAMIHSMDWTVPGATKMAWRYGRSPYFGRILRRSTAGGKKPGFFNRFLRRNKNRRR
ncbi:MAG: transglutaminase-like domain-containing protein [Candidatus Diapherotrites archaeon]